MMNAESTTAAAAVCLERHEESCKQQASFEHDEHAGACTCSDLAVLGGTKLTDK
jgi:hypothetical protein